MNNYIMTPVLAIPDNVNPGRGRTFHSVEAGRGIAALLVVLYHADRLMPNPAYWGARALGGIFAFGHAGVDFFFVLSGFIIAHVHRNDIGRPSRLRNFAIRRFVRIYPLYWLVLTALVALSFAYPHVASLHHVDGAVVLESYFLAGPESHGGVLTVSWTLFHEVLFYCAFAFFIIDRRAGIFLLGAWITLIALNETIGVPEVPSYVDSPLNLLFAGGVMVEAAVRYGVRWPAAWAFAGIAAFTALAVEETGRGVIGEMPRNLAYGAASVVALIGFVTIELKSAIPMPRVIRILGAASYSIYLVHYPLMSVVARTMRQMGLVDTLPETIGLILLVVIVMAIGVATHFVIERPLLARLTRRTRRPSPLALETRL